MALNTESDGNGNGDEGGNRTFRTAAIALGGIGLLGVVLIAVFMISSSGQRAQLLAQQQAANATNEAIAQAALFTATPEPTETPLPTETPIPLPPTAVPTLPPTVAPTQVVLQPVVVTSTTPTATPASGQVSGIGPAASAPLPTIMATKGALSPSGQVSGITPTSSPKAPTETPKTGAGDFLGLLFAAGLIALLIVARRLRMSQA